MPQEETTTSNAEATTEVADAAAGSQMAAADSEKLAARSRRRNAARPLWQYICALVLVMGAITFAIESYKWSAHRNDSWGGKIESSGPTLTVDEQIAKIKSDTTMPESAKKRAISALGYAKSMEAAHRH